MQFFSTAGLIGDQSFKYIRDNVDDDDVVDDDDDDNNNNNNNNNNMIRNIIQ